MRLHSSSHSQRGDALYLWIAGATFSRDSTLLEVVAGVLGRPEGECAPLLVPRARSLPISSVDLKFLPWCFLDDPTRSLEEFASIQGVISELQQVRPSPLSQANGKCVGC